MRVSMHRDPSWYHPVPMRSKKFQQLTAPARPRGPDLPEIEVKPKAQLRRCAASDQVETKVKPSIQSWDV